jgi:endonuclease G
MNWWNNKTINFWPFGTTRNVFLAFFGMIFGAIILIASTHIVYGEPAPQACETQFYNKQMPDYDSALWLGNDPSRPPEQQIYTLCYTQFGLQNSAITKTPLWSAEHLTSNRIKAAQLLKRKNTFHAEPLIAVPDRATLADYLRSGYDRGHMSPDKDQPDALSMYESFSLANMVPQNPCNNEIIWAAIEESVRNYVLTSGEVYVVTGPIFGLLNGTNTTGTIGTSKVYIPVKLFKAVYDPAKNAIIVIVTDNANVQTYDSVTLAELEGMTGITVFPTIQNPSALVLPPLHKMSGSCKKGE